MVRFGVDLELLDQGKQAQLVHAREGFGPENFPIDFPIIIIWRWLGEYTDKCVVEMGDGGDVPRVAGQGASEESFRLVDEMGHDHFNYLQGESGGGGWARRGNLR